MNVRHTNGRSRAISIAATTGHGRSLVHPRLTIAVILAIQIAFTVLFLLAGIG